eukprot:scaffold11341_cov28-Tisochrysis_lutea.AAC.6
MCLRICSNQCSRSAAGTTTRVAPTGNNERSNTARLPTAEACHDLCRLSRAERMRLIPRRTGSKSLGRTAVRLSPIFVWAVAAASSAMRSVSRTNSSSVRYALHPRGWSANDSTRVKAKIGTSLSR